MATCEKLANCPFYQGSMSINSGLGKMYKEKYCEGDKTISTYTQMTKFVDMEEFK